MKTTINEVVEDAIILKRTPYKDNDYILHVYTKTYGKLGIIARGARKMTSKNASSIQDLMTSELTFHLKKGLCLLMKAQPIHYYPQIKENIECEIIANYVLEYFYRYAGDNQPQEGCYETIIAALDALEKGYPPLLVYLLFDVFMLKQNGVELQVDGCAICGQPEVVSISIGDGGFVCMNHLKQRQFFDVEVLKAFRYIQKVPMVSIGQLHIEYSVLLELYDIMKAFVDEYTGIVLKTQKFVEQII